MRQLKLTALALVASALSVCTVSVQAAEPAATAASAPASAEISGVHQAKVTSRLVAVDAAARQITIDFPKGQQTVIEVGDSVKNLDKFKVGSLALVRYTDSLTLTPGAASGAVNTVVVANPLDHIVVLSGPTGTMRVKVADDAGFKAFKAGDKVGVTSTKRVATNLSTVTRAKTKAAAVSAASGAN